MTSSEQAPKSKSEIRRETVMRGGTLDDAEEIIRQQSSEQALRDAPVVVQNALREIRQPHGRTPDAQKRNVEAACSLIEDAVASLESRIRELSQDAGWLYAHELEGELSLLRETALTRSEARTLIAVAEYLPPMGDDVWRPIEAKLSRLSAPPAHPEIKR